MDWKWALTNLENGALLGYEDTSMVREYRRIIEEYIKELERKVQAND